LSVKHVIPCANGTDALQIAMMGLGLEQGDEVITVDFTFAATVEVIALLKLTPVLIDVKPDTFNIDIDALKKSYHSKNKSHCSSSFIRIMRQYGCSNGNC